MPSKAESIGLHLKNFNSHARRRRIKFDMAEARRQESTMEEKLVAKLEAVASAISPLLEGFRLDLEKVQSEDVVLGEATSELAAFIEAETDRKKLLSKLAALKLEKKILKDGVYHTLPPIRKVSRGAGPSGVVKFR